MITFLASPKPFTEAAKQRQYRAIQSWQATGSDVEVILYGDSAGIEKAGDDLCVQVVKDVDHTPSGVPYFGAIAEHARKHARYDRQVYINCDILMTGITRVFERISLARFLIVGQRIDLSEGVFVDLSAEDWREQLNQMAEERKAVLHEPCGIDYFAFLRGTWVNLPPIIVGRGGYDNAIIAHCIRRQIPVVDATRSIIALHQFHNYAHITGGERTVFQGNEALCNFAQAGGSYSRTLISDATHVFQNGAPMYWPCRGDVLRWLELQLRLRYGWKRVGLLLRIPWRCLHATRISRRSSVTIQELTAAV